MKGLPAHVLFRGKIHIISLHNLTLNFLSKRLYHYHVGRECVKATPGSLDATDLVFVVSKMCMPSI